MMLSKINSNRKLTGAKVDIFFDITLKITVKEI